MATPEENDFDVDEAPATEAAPRTQNAVANLGAYRLIAGLGRGGMGDVFLAVKQGLGGFNKLVVIKQLRPSLVADTEFLNMFLDEARLAARLSHPNVVQTNEVGQDSANHYFIAMEYLDGQPYHRVLRKAQTHRHGKLSLELQIHVLLQVLDGLHYAHEVKDYDGSALKIVHRDISPQNIFITYSGEVKILDFGIAKAIGATVETRAGVYKGKLPYMSPEQMHGEYIDRRADLFSVGVMLWAAVVGHSLWHGVSNMEIARGLISGKIPSLLEAKPDAPADLVRICDRALAPQIEGRYPTALEFRRDLQAYLDSTGEEVTREQVVAAMEAMFADDRREMQRSIEAQIRDAKALTTGNFTVVPLPVVEGSSPHRDPGSERSGVLSRQGTPVSALGSQPSVIIHETGTAWKVAAIVIPLALLCGGGVMYLALGRDRSPAPVAVTAPAVPAAPALPVKPTTAQLSIQTTPPEASVTLDGAAVANPYQGQVALDGKPHQIHVEAPGFRAETRTVTVEQAVLVDIGMQREEAAAAVAVTNPAVRPEPKKRPAPAAVARPAPAHPTPSVKPDEPEKAKPKIDIIADPTVQIVE